MPVALIKLFIYDYIVSLRVVQHNPRIDQLYKISADLGVFIHADNIELMENLFAAHVKRIEFRPLLVSGMLTSFENEPNRYNIYIPERTGESDTDTEQLISVAHEAFHIPFIGVKLKYAHELGLCELLVENLAYRFVTRHKDKFRELVQKYGFPNPPEYQI